MSIMNRITYMLACNAMEKGQFKAGDYYIIFFSRGLKKKKKKGCKVRRARFALGFLEATVVKYFFYV